MSRASNLAGFGSFIGPPDDLNVGIVTAVSYYGDGSSLTGIDATSLKDGNGTVRVQANTSGAVVTGILTATSFTAGGAVVTGVSTFNDDIKGDTATNISGINSVTASSFYGDGSQLSGVVSGIELEQAGSSVGTSITAINFASGATLTTASAGISTVTISAPSISTTSSSPTANTVVTLDLSSAQHHELTLSAGITTITCSGGSFGDSHSVVLIQPSSGITTVGLSTYFLFPSGSSPSFSEGSSQIDLLSFVVKRVGAAGTQLLTSAGLNYL